jgi:pyruvate/2-oxoglutarate dehydrogenase complex dihydrolipoamide acyltransferase (E2) component
MSSYEIKHTHPFYDAARGMAEYECRPGIAVTFLSEVDLTAVEKLRERMAAAGEIKPSYTALVIKAVGRALREFPYTNRRLLPKLLPFRASRLQQFNNSDIAVACERNEAECAAFIDIVRDADRRTLADITGQLRALSTCDETNNEQWRKFRFIIWNLPRWLAKVIIRIPVFVPRLWSRYRGAAVFVSSPAKYGIDAVMTTWTHPIGISFGLVRPRAVVRGGQVVVRQTFNMTLNFDRRVMAGAQAARFFSRIADLLEHAETELVEDAPTVRRAAAAKVEEGALLVTSGGPV